jgi:heptosyltransferase-3
MKILVIRRDNIGDLVCTTPAFFSLRQAFPKAYIAALVNSYSAPVITGNPDINDVFIYTKGKHGANAQGILYRWRTTLCLLRKLRACQFDVIIAIGKSSTTLARLLSPKRIITAGEYSGPDTVSFQDLAPLHAVDAVNHYLSRLGINTKPGPLRVFPDKELLPPSFGAQGKAVIGLHLSARKPSQRWPVDCFAALANKLFAARGTSFRVFWAPGTQANPLHPGDDEKADIFRLATQNLPVQLCPSTQLGELVAAMSACDLVICGDGGAMHIAAGLGKPVLALFGDSDAQRWRPWGVPHQVFQPTSRDVADIAVDDVYSASLVLLDSIHTAAPNA